MAKLPYMQFYPADYLLDTQPLSLQARGAWMDLICLLWRAEKRGVLALHESQLARLLRCDLAALHHVLAELSEFRICDTVTNGNGDVTVRSRRMIREEKDRQSTKLRVRRHRVTQGCNAPVQECNRENQKSESEVRIRSQNQKSESEEEEKKEKENTCAGLPAELPAPPKSAGVWVAYAGAYARRYGVEPVRNRKTNALLCQLVDRLGSDDAPRVAQFYVTLNNPVYVLSRHAANLLVRDCEGIRTQWATGVKATSGEAKNATVMDEVTAQVQRVEALMARGTA